MIIAHNLKKYARQAPKKIIDLFDSREKSFKYLHAILHAKLTRSFQGVKKVSDITLNTSFLFCYILRTYFWTVAQERKTKGLYHNMNFLFLFDSFPSCSYQSLAVTTTLYRSLWKKPRGKGLKNLQKSLIFTSFFEILYLGILDDYLANFIQILSGHTSWPAARNSKYLN